MVWEWTLGVRYGVREWIIVDARRLAAPDAGWQNSLRRELPLHAPHVFFDDLSRQSGHQEGPATAPGEALEFILESELCGFFKTHGLAGRSGK